MKRVVLVLTELEADALSLFFAWGGMAIGSGLALDEAPSPSDRLKTMQTAIAIGPEAFDRVADKLKKAINMDERAKRLGLDLTEEG